jgi:hypothetical protein
MRESNLEGPQVGAEDEEGFNVGDQALGLGALPVTGPPGTAPAGAALSHARLPESARGAPTGRAADRPAGPASRLGQRSPGRCGERGSDKGIKFGARDEAGPGKSGSNPSRHTTACIALPPRAVQAGRPATQQETPGRP